MSVLIREAGLGDMPSPRSPNSSQITRGFDWTAASMALWLLLALVVVAVLTTTARGTDAQFQSIFVTEEYQLCCDRFIPESFAVVSTVVCFS
jgi:hypothetical protein